MIEHQVAIALGSNLGDRQEHLQHAVTRLREFTRDLRVSSLIETAPVGVGVQPVFLNGVAVGWTSLSARELLNKLSVIESERNRERPYHGAPRTLDLDVILYADQIIDEPGLSVPHPRFREREFVLRPLAELTPDLVDPVSGRTVKELLENLRGDRRNGQFDDWLVG